LRNGLDAVRQSTKLTARVSGLAADLAVEARVGPTGIHDFPPRFDDPTRGESIFFPRIRQDAWCCRPMCQQALS